MALLEISKLKDLQAYTNMKQLSMYSKTLL